MSSRDIAYVGTFLTESLVEADEWTHYSPAGQAQQGSTIAALAGAGCRVDAVSATMPVTEGIGTVPGRVATNDDARVHVPPNLDVTPSSRFTRPVAFLETVQNKVVLPLVVTIYLCRLVWGREFDAIVFYNFNVVTAFPALIAGLLYGVPIVVDFNDSRLDSGNRLDVLKDRVYLYVVDPWVAGGICINSRMCELLRTENTVVVRGEPSVRVPDTIGTDGDPDRPLTVLYGGRLDETRGIETILAAVPDLVAERDVAVHVAGYGPKYEAVKRRVAEMETDRVTFLGNLSTERYREELLAADVALNAQSPDAPGNEYTFPTKVLDYLATGNVVVSTRISDLETELSDVLVFTGPTAREFSSTVGRVVDEFDGCQPRVDAGLAWVRENCSPERRIDSIAALLDDVCPHADGHE